MQPDQEPTKLEPVVEQSELQVPTSAPDMIPEQSSVTQPASNSVLDKTKPKPPLSKKLIISIIAGSVALIFGGLAAAYFLWYQAPQKVMNDALASIMTASSVRSDLDMEYKADGNALELSSAIKANESFMSANMSGTLITNGVELPLDISMYAGKDATMYVNIKKVSEMIDSALGESASIYKEYFADLLSKIDGEWISMSADDLDKLNTTSSAASSCFETAVKKMNDNSATVGRAVYDLYNKYPLFVVVKSLGSKTIGTSNSTGYEVRGSNENLKKFALGLSEITEIKALGECDESYSISEANIDEFIKNSDSESGAEDGTLEIWADSFTHVLTEISGKSSDGTFSLSFRPVMNDVKDVPTAPTAKTSISDIMNEISLGL